MKKGPKTAVGLLADSPEALEGRLEELDRKIERLRSLYESYFMGVERMAPATPRRELNRLMLETQQVPITNASMRFRFQTISHRWVLYTSYWNRTLREIEMGTYRRDLARAQRHLAAKGGSMTIDEAIAIGIPSSRAKAFVDRQSKARPSTTGVDSEKTEETPPEPRALDVSPMPERTPPPAPLPGLADDDIASFYGRYMEARKAAHDPRPAIPLDELKTRLLSQAPKLASEGKVARVDLEVAIEDGKVRMRVRPVRD